MNTKKIAIISGTFVLFVIILLLVVFVNKKYEVKFDSKGGSIIEKITVKKNGKIDRPIDPVKDGYEFDDWYLNDKIFSFNTPITKNITLIAKWISINDTDEVKKYNVSFNTDGGNSISTIRIEKNDTISEPEIPTKEGYNFVSWQLDGKDFDFKTKITSNIELVAKWEKIKNDTTISNKTNTTTNKKTNTTTNKKTNDTTNNTTSNTNKNTTPSTVSVTGISISKTSLNLGVGQNFTLTTEVNPSNATNKSISWSSSNDSIATVNSNGVVTAKAAGTAVITVKTEDGSKSATCTIKIQDVYSYTTSVYELNDTMAKVYVFKNNVNITSTVSRILTSSNGNLGAYDNDATAVLINKTEISNINKALINGKTYEIIVK